MNKQLKKKMKKGISSRDHNYDGQGRPYFNPAVMNIPDDNIYILEKISGLRF